MPRPIHRRLLGHRCEGGRSAEETPRARSSSLNPTAADLVGPRLDAQKRNDGFKEPHATPGGVIGRLAPHTGPTDAQRVGERRLVVVSRSEEVDRQIPDVVGPYHGGKITTAIADQLSALHDPCLLGESRTNRTRPLGGGVLLGWS
jgi:hypothetical protein